MFIADDAVYYTRRAEQEAALAASAQDEKSHYLHVTLAAEYRRRAALSPAERAKERARHKVTIVLD
jgi:hypothetical protein